MGHGHDVQVLLAHGLHVVHDVSKAREEDLGVPDVEMVDDLLLAVVGGKNGRGEADGDQRGGRDQSGQAGNRESFHGRILLFWG